MDQTISMDPTSSLILSNTDTKALLRTPVHTPTKTEPGRRLSLQLKPNPPQYKDAHSLTFIFKVYSEWGYEIIRKGPILPYEE